jgi:hypothetical protein
MEPPSDKKQYPLPRPLKQKVFYSKLHLDALDAKVTRYLENPLRPVVIQQHGTIEDPSITITPNEVPAIIRLCAGDALQNLRSTLDYLVWELVLANQGIPDEYNAFPVCKTPKGFKEAKKRRLRSVDPKAIAIIDSLQPLHFGQDKYAECSLFVLDEMTNINKHRSILMARPRAVPLEDMLVPGSEGNPIYDSSLVGDDEASARLIESAIKMKVNRQIAMFIQFDEGPVKGYEVMSAIHGLYYHVVAEILPKFERFF